MFRPRIPHPYRLLVVCGSLFWAIAVSLAADTAANRLDYLDGPIDPYYVGRDFPRLVTPQWVGERDVVAVVVLAIDDMRDPARYEAYLRPILDRLKHRQGRASLSIMTNQIDPQDAQVQAWLDEGVNIDVHTIDHPCPLLCDNDLQKARLTYERCVDLMSQIPGNEPTAFRMPCCDSMNSPSPRFFEAIFEQVTERGNYLTIDSSVFNLTTEHDASLPSQLLEDEAGLPRFRKYLPFRSFVNTIEDYPYPYVIGHTCWEFPCIVPSDWEAQNLHQPNNPQTLTDLQAALDVVVRKQGVMNLVFHPHGWIRSDQVAQLVDYAAETYGSRVRFLNFREAQQRLDQNLLPSMPLRNDHGQDNGVRMLDINGDGYLDVVRLGPEGLLRTRLWQPDSQQWQDTIQDLPAKSLHFGVIAADGQVGMFAVTQKGPGLYVWTNDQWQQQEFMIATQSLSDAWRSRIASPTQLDAVRWRDLDGDGRCELLLAKGPESLILRGDGETWRALSFGLPAGVRLASAAGRDAGLRWIDLDNDGRDECVFSDATHYSAHRWVSVESGWQTLLQRQRDQPTTDPRVIPPFVRPDGSNNGVWVHSSHLWWQNEDTARLPDKVDRLTLAELIESPPTEGAADAAGFPGPLDPDAALKSFRSSIGAKIELVAAEPLVTDPIAFDWAPDGRLFVVEMRDYPEDMDDPHPPRGRVRVLIDDDQDGRYDRAETFLDALHYPTGVKVWREGVLISGAPEIILATDTDGDQRADQTKVLFRGFGEGNQQHRINGLRWGIDNWLYLANGDSGGRIESFAGGEPVSLSGRDLRIDPDTGRMEALSGLTQYGRARDDLGNWFGGNNSDPLWHYVLEDRYLSRNRSFAPPAVRRQVPEVPGPAPVFPVSRTLPRFNDFDRADRFTSACGHLVVHDSGFGPAGSIESFVCEPVHNLVHREVLTADGVSFRSHRVPEDREAEFLASTDNWFRPVLARIGPDGAIWIADMYRLVIEHPTWIPQHWQKLLDLRAGYDRGRIYRVIPQGRSVARDFPRLDQLTPLELVQRLDHPNRWQRDTAQQLLLWRADAATAEPLRQLVHTARYPIAKMQALYLLSALQAMDDEWLAGVIRQAEPAVARHAIRVAESRLADSSVLLESVLARVDTDDRPLQQQLAYSLGYAHDPRVAAALASLALREPAEPVIQAAVMSSLRQDNVGQVLRQVAAERAPHEQESLFADLLGQAVALGDAPIHVAALECLLQFAADDGPAWRLQTLSELLSQYSSRHLNLDALPATLRDALLEQIVAARALAVNSEVDLATRRAAVSLLRSDLNPERHNQDILESLLDPRQPPEIQAAAGSALLRYFSEEAVSPLLFGWNGFSPRTRDQLLTELLRRSDLTVSLLESAQRQQLDLQLDARRRQQLLDANDARVRSAAEALFAAGGTASREELITAYRPPAGWAGDLERGRQTFQRVCSSCHRFSGQGYAVGPELEALSNKSVDFLVTAILDPNRAVESNYLDFHVETVDGLQYTGILRSETANSVTLLAADAKEQRILRDDIELMNSTGKSLMPEGLEKDLTAEQLWDLLAYLQSYQPERKAFAGNQPQVAPRRDDGSIRLLAMHAEIYGPTLVFEPHYRNLGFWGSPLDYAAWTVEVPQAGQFSLSLDYACAASSAGNRFLIHCGDQQLEGLSESTGTWDNYRSKQVGRLYLPAGRSRIVIRGDGLQQGYLMDLHQMVLQPVD